MRARFPTMILALALASCGGPAPARVEPAAGEPAPSGSTGTSTSTSTDVGEAVLPLPQAGGGRGEGGEDATSTSTSTSIGGFAACPASLPDNMACIPGAVITRGSDDGEPNERPAAPVRVSTFLIDVHEVDNAHYAECVAAGRCQRLVPFPDYMGPTQPAVGMRWQDADAYCAWRDKRLPTEAEWERAASGPDETRYPWGDDATDAPCDRAIVMTRAGRGCGTGVTWPVGSRPPGPWGVYDMAGNVWEWVADHYSWCYRGCSRECGDACFVDDPQGRCGDSHAACPESLGHRTVRGGSWWYPIDRATTTARRGAPGENPNPHRFGFRCARGL